MTETVYVVVTTHPDDPHAKVEGVYRNEEDAMRGERDAIRGFGALTAMTYEMEIRGERSGLLEQELRGDG